MGPYNNPDIEKFEYNPEKAKQEIEKLGWKLGSDGIYEKEGTKLAFEITAGESDQVRVDMAKICAQQLKEIGVDAKAVVVTETDWANQDAHLIGWEVHLTQMTIHIKYLEQIKVQITVLTLILL